MNRTLLIAACAAIAFSSASDPAAPAASGPAPGGPAASASAGVGEKAPVFELPALGLGGAIRSADLFAAHRSSFLVFWDSACPHCVELLQGCESFFERYGGADIAVVGICAGGADALVLGGIVESGGIRFPQLRDEGSSVARRYGVPPETFAIFLVDGAGVIGRAALDPSGDTAAIMEGMLQGAVEPEEAQPPSTAPAAGAPARGGTREGISIDDVAGFAVTGGLRIRFLGIDARGDGAVGPYGERLAPRNTLLYRFTAELAKPLGEHFAVGALVRLGNEGEEVLESGPEYLGSRYGSAYAIASAGRLSVRLGYYPVSMTPLSLMRWDWNDNPRTGGDAGCGCGTGVGVLFMESLEELGPELLFEGGLASWEGRTYEARIFYAIPRRARETTYLAYRYAGDDVARYSLEIYGAEGRWQRLDRRTGSFWKAGLHFAGSWENRRSVDFAALGYPAAPTWFSSEVFTATAEAPILRFVSLRGEYVLRNRSIEHGIMTDAGPVNVEENGNGAVAGIVFERSPRSFIRLEYLRLDDGFSTPFAAMSYEPGSEGVRASASVPLVKERAAAAVFCKLLREIDPAPPAVERTKKALLGASLDIDTAEGWGGSVGWIERWAERRDILFPIDDSRTVWTASARYRFGKWGTLQAQYQRIAVNESQLGVSSDSRADIFSVYCSAGF